MALYSLDLSDAEAEPRILFKLNHAYPAVSPDGSLVAVQEYGYLVVRRLDGPDKPPNREPNEIVAKYMTNIWHGLLPTWSPDSRFVTFGTFGRGDEKGLHLLDVAANQEQILVPGSRTLARWSPDGKRLAMDDRVKGEIVIVDISGLNLAEKPPAKDAQE